MVQNECEVAQWRDRDDIINFIETELGADRGFPLGSFDDTSHTLQQICLMLDVAMPIAFGILDPDMRYVHLNPQVYLMFGLSPDQLGVGDHISRTHQLMKEAGLMDDELMTISEIEHETLQHIPAGERQERIVALHDGRFCRLTRVRLANDYTVSIAEDVTDLMNAQSLLQDALSLGNAGYWLYNFDSKSYEISDSLKWLLSEEQVRAAETHGPIVMVHPDDRDSYREAMMNMRANKDSFRVTTRAAFMEGMYFRSSGRILRSPDGQAQKLQCFVQNITKQIIRSRELEIAKDEAVAANITKSQFLANMSHEIRTPMNGVLGMAELLASSALDDRQRDFVDVITSSATSLLTVINDILDFSKIEAGALELEHHPFSLREIVTDVASLLAHGAAEKGVELIINYPEREAQSFVGDAVRVRQVLTNLMGNALKFTETGHVVIAVTATPDPSGNALIRASVTDTGIGIEADKLLTVFDKFTQADNSTTRIYGGTGLGLSISKRLAEIMGGDLGVESTYGEGSTFTLTLPLPLDKSAKPVVRNTAPIRGKRALIVDDIDINRRLLSEQLSGWGMSTLAVADGVDALAALKAAQKTDKKTGKGPESGTAPFDIVIMDYLMPGVNGREVASMIHAMPELDLPILMLSSCDESHNSERDGLEGVDRYLVKPVREQALYDAMLGMLYRDTDTAVDSDRVVVSASSRSANKTDTKQVAMTATEIESERTFDRIHVLVAEDFPLNQDVVRLMLADTRYAPVIVDNGALAVEAYRERPEHYAAVLMDVSMPVMDGYMATGEIRATETAMHHERTPVIALTGHALTHEREKCIEAGMDDYLTKPVKQIELIGALDRWTGHETRIAVA